MHRILLSLAALALFAASAGAQVSSERGASVLIFPKVVADSSADTVLQVTNLSGVRVGVFCSYVDGTDGWAATSFTLRLEPAQPLSWSAARGREAGDDNSVPPAPAGMRGELLCVETDTAGAPAGDNRLVGQATVAALADADLFSYAAVGLQGSGFNDGDDVLCVGGDVSDSCFIGPEYDPCPAEWLITHPAAGAGQPQGDGTVTPRVAITPCSQNVRDADPATVDIDIAVTNAFGERFTGTQSVTCWADLSLGDVAGGLFDRAGVGSDVVQTSLKPAAGSGGFVLAVEAEYRASGGAVQARAGLAPLPRGAGSGADLIVLPMGRP
ncbi:MAG: hypothetical protein SF182_09400 [Deltaproteobacteria bacterium]|nr:hypothetical protein [Deltaproteobacteria bacterium]